MDKVSTKPAQTPKIVYLIGVEGTTPHHTPNTLSSLIMRKIERQMCAAVQKNINWQSANTSVHFDEESGVSVVRLHGNKIAEVDDTSMTIFDGGWQTTTTKSRLNALITEFCNGVTDGVFQKNYEWFIMDNKQVVDFENGYTFA